MALRPKGWHPEDIKAALRKKHGSITRLAERWGYHRTAISTVLRRPGASAPVELRIAQALDLSPHILWPDRWSPEGALRPGRQRADHSNPSDKSHRQKRGAA